MTTKKSLAAEKLKLDKAHIQAEKAKAKAETERVKAKAAQAAAKANQMTGGHIDGFITFIRTQGVIGLAIGLAIGTAATATVKTIVVGFITPIVQFLIGSESKLDDATYTFSAFGRQAEFAWGAAASSTITLIATAFVIYLIIHFTKLDRLDKPKE